LLAINWLQGLFFVLLLAIFSPLLGVYIASLYTRPSPGRLETLCYRFSGIDSSVEMTWTEYGWALLYFNFFGLVGLFSLQLIQNFLPLNPQDLPGVPWATALNTAISFTTNTNWQSYAGETTMSYLTQMLGLASQNFLSAATGMAVLVAFTRGLIGKGKKTLGNFWVDLVRTLIYLLLPLSILVAVFLVGEGVVQSFSPYVETSTLEGGKQTIPLGPVASQVAIKQLGTNGGGYFNANSAHPFENPTALTNLIEMFAIMLIPCASVFAYGSMIGSRRHAMVLLLVMIALWSFGNAVSFMSEKIDNPVFSGVKVLEGQEVRFGVVNSVLWTTSTTATSNGSVNAMISSLSPLTGGTALFNIMLGELIFGGVGVGLCSMIMFVLLTIFLSGLMVGRTPEYLGKKIEKGEVRWMMFAILLPGAMILIGSGFASVYPVALESILNKGPHGLSEILYAFSSAAGNNGSAFAGLNAGSNFYNLSLALIMLLGRVSIILPSLAIAGLLANKTSTPESVGTFSTHSVLFALLLFCFIVLIGGLTFFPALSLGPIVEQLLMLEGRTF
jgi:K+-transporting ATPase ATPase A chain